jgi:hypothetical protein
MVKINGPDPTATQMIRRALQFDLPPPTILIVVEVNGFEPMASCVQGRRSPS